MTTPTVFISYSHKDEPWKDRLVAHLGGLQQQGLLDVWDDRRIEAGDDWRAEIEAAIQAASIAILLISANFLSSKFITQEEIPRLLQRRQRDGIRILPIILKPCDWQGIDWLATLQACPLDGRPLSAGNDHQIETDLAAIAREIRELLQRAELPRERPQYVPLPPDQISLARLPTTHHTLFGRDQRLQQLDDAWENPLCHVFCLVAFGGVGKTALVNEWLNRVGTDNWRGAERVYGWSFYSQGTRADRQPSADTFFEDALRFFGYNGAPLTSPWDKGKLLANLIRERKTLLILDGLEPLQYPPGVQEGYLRDPGLQALLKELARFNNGLVVLSTRCMVADIGPTISHSTLQIDLENLTPEAGMELLRETGVSKGTDRELQQAAVEYNGHALALTLLGRYLAIRYGGEIRKRDTIKKLMYEQTRQGAHAHHVMDSYELWLEGTPELDLLYVMGLFENTVQLEAIEILKQDTIINGLTERIKYISDIFIIIHNLVDLRLISISNEHHYGFLYCHPLIKEHFAEKLKTKNKQAWKEAHIRLYTYYKNLPEKLYGKRMPDTLEEMQPLFIALSHGCHAGFFNMTWEELYINKINRGKEAYCENKLGAFGAHLSALTCFFEEPWHKPASELSEYRKALLLDYAGFGLRALGRLREAIQPIKESIKLVIRRKDWVNAAIGVGTLSELYLTSGDVKQSIVFASQSVEYATRSMDMFQKYNKLAMLANAHHQAGELKKAEHLFQEAELLQKKEKPEYCYLYSLSGFWFCDLLLSQCKLRKLLDRYKEYLLWRLPSDSILDHALEDLSAGRAYLLEALNPTFFTYKNAIKKAKEHLENAMLSLRNANNQEFIAYGLFALTFLYRVLNDFDNAWGAIREALEITERGGMKLLLVDYHMEAARLRITDFRSRKNNFVKFNHEEFLNDIKFDLEQSVKLIQETGYNRRYPEVELGYAGLFIVQDKKISAKQHIAQAQRLLDQMGIRCWNFWVQELEEWVSGRWRERETGRIG